MNLFLYPAAVSLSYVDMCYEEATKHYNLILSLINNYPVIN